jgi:exopolyphosphatase/guanosine-5'-triphosphate,3'-diphosphate pyrophosphatase
MHGAADPLCDAQRAGGVRIGQDHRELVAAIAEDQIMIAHIARYHRGAAPKRRHREYAQLERDARRRIRRLAALLRLADGLDRGHVGAVKQLKVRWLARAVRVTLYPHTRATSVRLEVWGGARKSDLLERIVKRSVELVAPDGTVYENAQGNGDSR